jgi:hypothetical protein
MSKVFYFTESILGEAPVVWMKGEWVFSHTSMTNMTKYSHTAVVGPKQKTDKTDNVLCLGT